MIFRSLSIKLFSMGSMDVDWKEINIVLIPKVENPSTTTHFYSISLCKSIYKLVAKTLLNRMYGMMTKIVSKEQVAFLK